MSGALTVAKNLSTGFPFTLMNTRDMETRSMARKNTVMRTMMKRSMATKITTTMTNTVRKKEFSRRPSQMSGRSRAD